MKTTKLLSKSIKYLLANQYGSLIYLSVPNDDGKYYLDYNQNGRKKYYGKGSVKSKTVACFSSLISFETMKKTEIEAELADVFKEDLKLILHELESTNLTTSINMRSTVRLALEVFYNYKLRQNKEGTVNDVSLYGYTHHNKKVISYFNKR